MKFSITIDCGTTNTRVVLLKDNKVVQIFRTKVGVRNTAIEGNNSKLKHAVKSGIESVLANENITIHEIHLIVAAGMITSNVGLFEVNHIFAPSSLVDFVNNMVEVHLPDICDKPIWFIPGLKNNIKEVTVQNFANMDIMRGEEVEALYISKILSDKLPGLLVLPGSHTKFISMNSDQEILGCLTTLGGELISAVSENTIIASTVENRFATVIDEEFLIRGYKEAKKNHLSRALFSVRLLGQFTNTTQNQRANFLMGAILHEDIKAIINSAVIPVSRDMNVIITGGEILSDSFEILLKNEKYFSSVVKYSDKRFENISSKGSLLVAEKRGLIK